VTLGRLRWYGRVERKDQTDWVSACRELVVEGTTGKEKVERRGTSVRKLTLNGLIWSSRILESEIGEEFYNRRPPNTASVR